MPCLHIHIRVSTIVLRERHQRQVIKAASCIVSSAVSDPPFYVVTMLTRSDDRQTQQQTGGSCSLCVNEQREPPGFLSPDWIKWAGKLENVLSLLLILLHSIFYNNNNIIL